jgi:hypothetical protein
MPEQIIFLQNNRITMKIENTDTIILPRIGESILIPGLSEKKLKAEVLDIVHEYAIGRNLANKHYIMLTDFEELDWNY